VKRDKRQISAKLREAATAIKATTDHLQVKIDRYKHMLERKREFNKEIEEARSRNK